MKISPEPLHPLRSWRELWQPEPMSFIHGIREQASAQTLICKQQKRSAFHWISHLFTRNVQR